MKEDSQFTMEGQVVDILPNAMFRVLVDGHENPVIGVISGKMRQNNIKILLGDRVEIEFSVNDLTRGRIRRRK